MRTAILSCLLIFLLIFLLIIVLIDHSLSTLRWEGDDPKGKYHKRKALKVEIYWKFMGDDKTLDLIVSFKVYNLAQLFI